jgi:hypothetical protein
MPTQYRPGGKQVRTTLQVTARRQLALVAGNKSFEVENVPVARFEIGHKPWHPRNVVAHLAGCKEKPSLNVDIAAGAPIREIRKRHVSIAMQVALHIENASHAT